MDKYKLMILGIITAYSLSKDKVNTAVLKRCSDKNKKIIKISCILSLIAALFTLDRLFKPLDNEECI